MQPKQPAESAPWRLKLVLLVGLLLVSAFIAWLFWAMVTYAPTDEKDVIQSLLTHDMFNTTDVLLMSQPSDCHTGGVGKGSYSSAQFGAFLKANDPANSPLELYRYRPGLRIVDQSKSPKAWFYAEKKPVLSVSRAGIVEDTALVCVELYGQRDMAFIITMRNMGSNYWSVFREEVAWEAEIEPPPEEIPISTIPEVQ